VASVRSCEKLPPCLIKPTPSSSKTDSLVAKAKPITDGGSASVITCFSREEKNCGEMAVRERSEKMRNKSADTKVSEEGVGGGARDTGAESLPLQLVMQTMVRQVVPL